MNGMSLMEMLLNLIFYALDTEVVMDDMIDSILKLGLCGCYILVQVEKATCCSHFASIPISAYQQKTPRSCDNKKLKYLIYYKCNFFVTYGRKRLKDLTIVNWVDICHFPAR